MAAVVVAVVIAVVVRVAAAVAAVEEVDVAGAAVATTTAVLARVDVQTLKPVIETIHFFIAGHATIF